MLDIKFVIENKALVKENLMKRFQLNKIKQVDEIINDYKTWKRLKQNIDILRSKRNKLSEEINELKKKGKSSAEKISKAKKLPKEINLADRDIKRLEEKINISLKKLPNIIHKSVPKGKTEKQNKVLKKWGKISKPKFIKNHVELLENLNQIDFDASAKVSGNGFYYLKNEFALLNQALIRFAIDFMKKKKYSYIEPPLMVNKNIAAAAGDLEAFKTALYKIENEDSYLIPTAEHAILGMLINKTIKEKDLPLKLFGYSMCFRKEIGSHGINEKGLWRTHQFNKVEQFIFCKPKDSDKLYNELLKNSEEIIKQLKIPYRVVEFCSGDLSNWKAKSADIEVYRPTTKAYEEVGSLSNCTDYQARDLNIKAVNNKGERYVVHTLNNTALATSRILVAIVENYQQEDGSINIPTVLQKYTGFKKIVGVKDAKNKRTNKRRNKKGR